MEPSPTVGIRETMRKVQAQLDAVRLSSLANSPDTSAISAGHGRGSDSHAPASATHTSFASQASHRDSQGSVAGGMAHTSELMRNVADALGALKGNAAEAGDVLLRQAAGVAAVSDLLGQLYRAIEECVRLTKDTQDEKEEMTELVNELSHQMAAERNHNSTLTAANSQLQDHIKELKQELKEKKQLLDLTQDQLHDLATVHENSAKDAQQLRGIHLEVEMQLDELSAELQHERGQKEALKIAKQQLQQQLKHMVKAEKDLTKGLREAHEQIEEQMQQLRQDVSHEKSAKESLKSKKNALQSNLKELTNKAKSDQQLMDQLQLELYASKQNQARLAAELKSERKALKTAQQNEVFYQEALAEAEAHMQLVKIKAQAKENSKGKKGTGAKRKAVSKRAAEESQQQTVVISIPKPYSPRRIPDNQQTIDSSPRTPPAELG